MSPSLFFSTPRVRLWKCLFQVEEARHCSFANTALVASSVAERDDDTIHLSPFLRHLAGLSWVAMLSTDDTRCQWQRDLGLRLNWCNPNYILWCVLANKSLPLWRSLITFFSPWLWRCTSANASLQLLHGSFALLERRTIWTTRRNYFQRATLQCR